MDLKWYFQLFWMPALASAVLVTTAWVQDEMSPRTRAVVTIWFVLALAAQYFGGGPSAMWAAGIGGQTVLAVSLLLKRQLDQI